MNAGDLNLWQLVLHASLFVKFVMLVLLVDALLPAAQQRLFPQLCQARQLVGRRHGDVLRGFGGPSRDRTCDQPVMSRML